MSSNVKITLNQPYSSQPGVVHCPKELQKSFSEGTKFGSYPDAEFPPYEAMEIIEAGFGVDTASAPAAEVKAK